MRVDEIAESPILSLIDRIFQLKAAGSEILPLHIGEPDFATPAGIREAAVKALSEGLTHYTSAQGMPDLREAIAHRLRKLHGIPAGPAQVVVLPAKFAIYASLLATVDPGDEVLLPDPTYLFEQPIVLAGAKPVYVPLRPDLHLDVEGFRRAVTSRSRVLILATPANPTGQTVEAAEGKELLELAREAGLTVVSDETYASLVYEGRHVALASLPDADGRVITVGSFSKTYAMTGWRAGYVVAPPSLVPRFVKVMEHTLTCIPPFIQRACLWAIENAEPDAERFREEFRRRRDRVLGALQKIPELTVPRPPGAFYVFPKYNLGIPSVEFSKRLLEEEKVAVVPGIAFGPSGEGHLRIAYTRPLPELEEGIERLGRFLGRQAGPP